MNASPGSPPGALEHQDRGTQGGSELEPDSGEQIQRSDDAPKQADQDEQDQEPRDREITCRSLVIERLTSA